MLEPKVGDRVRYAEPALRSSRDWWQSQGREPQKSRAKDEYLAKCAERGVITAVKNTAYAKNSLEILWDIPYDSGQPKTCSCLNYMVELATD